MHKQSSSELDWLAFQYVAGELTADEAAEFEDRLAREQQAREAVARAVEVTQAAAVALHYSTPAVSHPNRCDRSPRRWTWAVAGVAASLAVALACSSWLRHAPPSHRQNVTENDVRRPEAHQLALAWAVARTDLVPEVREPEVVELAAPLPEQDDPDAEGIETPSWMFTAVASVAGGADAAPRVD